MVQQSSNGNRPTLSEKGLSTPDNGVVALIDHQGQMLFGTTNFDRQGIINNTVAFGKAASVFDAADRVALTPRTETVGLQHHRLDLSGLSVCAVPANGSGIKQKLQFLNPSHFQDVCSTANTREHDCTKFKENNGDTHEESRRVAAKSSLSQYPFVSRRTERAEPIA